MKDRGSEARQHSHASVVRYDLLLIPSEPTRYPLSGILTIMYKTSDIYLASVLSLRIPCTGMVRDNPKRVSFVFSDEQLANEIAVLYHKKELKVIPQEAFNALRALKARLYSEE